MGTLRNILLIEDEPDIRTVAKLALEAVGGYHVEVAASGPEGVALAQRVPPDLILLDVMMPGMDGVATFQALREVSVVAHAPVVFLTAKAQRHEIEHYRTLGAAGVISKPFDPLTLSQLVEAIWNEQHGTNEQPGSEQLN
ncbi:MAG: response regulator [Chloroflexi bacterium]|nr:response regulator [Chloroflexota bacterium]GIW10935.1 MAG: response regulator [Dehalococcoidia bacterium]